MGETYTGKLTICIQSGEGRVMWEGDLMELLAGQKRDVALPLADLLEVWINGKFYQSVYDFRYER